MVLTRSYVCVENRWAYRDPELAYECLILPRLRSDGGRHQPSVHYEQLGAASRRGTMGRVAVAYLIAHPWLQGVSAPVSQFCLKFAFQAKHNVPLRAPMVGQVPRRVFHNPDSNVAANLGAPKCASTCSGMLRRTNRSPIRDFEWNRSYFHRFDHSGWAKPFPFWHFSHKYF